MPGIPAESYIAAQLRIDMPRFSPPSHDASLSNIVYPLRGVETRRGGWVDRPGRNDRLARVNFNDGRFALDQSGGPESRCSNIRTNMLGFRPNDGEMVSTRQI